MKVEEAMSKSPAFCAVGSSAQTAAAIMNERGVGILPVVEDAFSRKLVGVVTDRDLCRVVIGDGRDPAHVWVRECMSEDPVTCGPDDEIGNAIRLMKENQLHRIPVVNRSHEILGILSITDLVFKEIVTPEEVFAVLERVSERMFEPKRIKAAR